MKFNLLFSFIVNDFDTDSFFLFLLFLFFFFKKKSGNLEIVNFLLEKGATPDFSRVFPAACGVCIFALGFVLLMFRLIFFSIKHSTKGGNMEIVQMFFEMGGRPVDSFDDIGNFPLRQASAVRISVSECFA